jgi:hypothetical protein
MPYREPARRTTRYLRLCLDVLTKPTSCSAPWDSMDVVRTPDDDACRICHRCSARVHDVTAMDPREAETFLAEHMSEKRPPKLSLLRRRDGRLIENECFLGKESKRSRRVLSLFGVLALAATIIGLVR